MTVAYGNVTDQAIPARPLAAVATAGHRERLEELRVSVERRLDELSAPRDEETEALSRSVRHSLLAPCKRTRPALLISTAAFFGADEALALDPACAVEMVHTASLIVDDMPAMDDARLRRGWPANHRVFGEHVATLAAFHLLSSAFGAIARAPGLTGELRARLAACLSDAIGAEGLIGGQLIDLRSTRQHLEAGEVETMYTRKTGALLGVAVELGARVAGVDGPAALLRLGDFSRHFGLAFQILDDLKDRFGAAGTIGKDVGQDASKTSFLTHASPREAREEVARLRSASERALSGLGTPGEQLAELSRALLDETAGDLAGEAR